MKADRPRAAGGGLLFSECGCDADRACALLIKSVELVCPASDGGTAALVKPIRSFNVPDRKRASGGAFPRDGGRCSSAARAVVGDVRELCPYVADAGLRCTSSARRSASGSPSNVEDRSADDHCHPASNRREEDAAAVDDSASWLTDCATCFATERDPPPLSEAPLRRQRQAVSEGGERQNRGHSRSQL